MFYLVLLECKVKELIMRSKEKINFILGSFILVLTISVGYLGLSSTGNTYAVDTDCPTGYTKSYSYSTNLVCVSSSDVNKIYSTNELTCPDLTGDNGNNFKGTPIKLSSTSIGCRYAATLYTNSAGCKAKGGIYENTQSVLACSIGGSSCPSGYTLEKSNNKYRCYKYGCKTTNGDYNSNEGVCYYYVSTSGNSSSGGSSTSDCSASYLYYGCSGSYVKSLQKKLNQVHGCGLDVDGGYGSNTKNCVISFQKAFGLEADGVAGTATFNKLDALYSSIKVSLDNVGATSNGTSSIYQLYNKGYYLDSANSKKMSTSANKITIPSKSYNVIYDYNDGSNKKVTKKVYYKFEGYYNSKNVQYINSSGYLTSSASNKYFQRAGTLNTKWSGGSLTLDKAERSGYTFLGWSTTKTSTTASYKANQSLNVDKNITLYAVWSSNSSSDTTKKYTIKFDANGGTGTTKEVVCTVGSNCILTKNSFSREKFKFNGWNTKKDGTGVSYSDCAVVKDLISSNGGIVTLYAKWKQDGLDVNTYKVTFKYNDDVTKDKVIEVDENDTVSIEVPERKGYAFGGWYTDKDLTKEYVLTTKVTKDITLYAKWISVISNDKTDEEITTNSETGDVMMFIAWTIGIGALAYAVYYYKTRIEE